MQSSKTPTNSSAKSPVKKMIWIFYFFTKAIQCHFQKHSNLKGKSQGKHTLNLHLQLSISVPYNFLLVVSRSISDLQALYIQESMSRSRVLLLNHNFCCTRYIRILQNNTRMPFQIGLLPCRPPIIDWTQPRF